MAKLVSKFGTREVRKKLKPSGSKPYLEGFEKDLDFGYWKGKRGGGSWKIRRYLGDRRYAFETIGAADDDAEADGAKVLTYHQARDKARERVQALAEEARIESLGPAVTVRSAIEEYLIAREKREVKDHDEKGIKRDARSRLTRHVLAVTELASKALASLTKEDLSGWREGLRLADGSIRRTSNDLKAALNAAARNHEAKLPPRIRDIIKDGLRSEHAAAPAAREAQVLTDADVRKIIAAAGEVDAEGDWGGDLARIVLVLAATGARFSQLIRVTVADVQAPQSRLMVPVSRKGRGVKRATHTGIRVGDDVLKELKKATAGRKGSDPLFLRPHWRQTGPARWEKADRGPWFAAAELTRPWAEVVVKAELASGTVPYALRHSSIVRGLREGLPVRLVAALHDTSSAMIERHYAAFIVDAMDELAARAVIPLTTEPVRSIAEARAARG